MKNQSVVVRGLSVLSRLSLLRRYTPIVATVLVILACLLPTVCLAAPTYYVSVLGNDSNAGSQKAPWRTIQHAVDEASAAGTTIMVRSGIYAETVNVTHSGSAQGGFLTVRAYPGDKPVLDGTLLGVPGGQGGLFSITDQSYVRVQGFELRNFRTTGRSVPMGILVTGRGDHIELLGNHIHNIETLKRGCAGNALGIAIYGTNARSAIDTVTISGNELDHLKTGCSESLSLNGNVQHFTVANNRIHDNNNIGIDVIGFEGFSANPATDQARNGVITGNTVYNITAWNNSAYNGHYYAADGIYVDGGRDVVIQRNRVHHVDIGIELASENAGRNTTNVIVRNNVVYLNNAVGITIGGYDKSVGGTRNCQIVNNTLYQNDTARTFSGEFQIQYNAAANVFKNNIMVANSQNLFVDNPYKTGAHPADVNFNMYYSATGSASVIMQWNGRQYASLAEFQKATGYATSATYADPQFRAMGATPRFDLSASSAAIDSGMQMVASVIGSSDFDGRNRVEASRVDIGATEF